MRGLCERIVREDCERNISKGLRAKVCERIVSKDCDYSCSDISKDRRY